MAIDLKTAKNELELAFLKLCVENATEVPLTAIDQKDVAITVDTATNKATVTVPLLNGYNYNGETELSFNWNVITDGATELFPLVEPVSLDTYESETETADIVAAVKVAINAAFIHPLDEKSVTITVDGATAKVDFSNSSIIHFAVPTEAVLSVPVTFKARDDKDLTDKIQDTTLNAFTPEDLIIV